ncbi:MAG: OB-fold nucleic acid binding domain-containing protein, partial [Pseudomonadota bacterium]
IPSDTCAATDLNAYRRRHTQTDVPPFAVRLGLREIDGLAHGEALKLTAYRDRQRGQSAQRGEAPFQFSSLREIYELADVSKGALERIARADAMRSLGYDRREALWHVHALRDGRALPLFHWQEGDDHRDAQVQVELPAMTAAEHVIEDYRTTRLSLKAHPLSFFRQELRHRGYGDCGQLKTMREGQSITLAGVVLVRQRPGSAKGVVFMTLEDETGVANAVVWPTAMERFRRIIMGARLVEIKGQVQRHENIIHVVVRHMEDRTQWLGRLGNAPDGEILPLANADEVRRPVPEGKGARWSPGSHPRNERVIPKSRDFH